MVEVIESLAVKELTVASNIIGVNAAGPKLNNVAATETAPTLLPNRAYPTNGIGGTSNSLDLISASSNALKMQWRAAGDCTFDVNANVGLTADVGSAQGNGVITSSFNVYDTVGTAGDAATLPSSFQVGTIIVVKNGAAANAMDVFPASGDDLGAGANTAVSIAAGNFKVFLGTTANSTWEQIMGGTA